MSDWLSKKEQDFMNLCEKWVATLDNTEAQKQNHWEAEACTAVVTKINTYYDAHTAFIGADTSVNRLAKNEAKEEARTAIRVFAASSIRFNPYMDEKAKLFMGVRSKDTNPTPHGRPASQPGVMVENTSNRFEHKVKAIFRDGRDSSKPDDAYGVRYAWQVGGEEPGWGDDLPKSQFSRRTSLIVSHTELDKGKPVWYAACYENSRGQKGPWSALAVAYVG